MSKSHTISVPWQNVKVPARTMAKFQNPIPARPVARFWASPDIPGQKKTICLFDPPDKTVPYRFHFFKCLIINSYLLLQLFYPVRSITFWRFFSLCVPLLIFREPPPLCNCFMLFVYVIIIESQSGVPPLRFSLGGIFCLTFLRHKNCI